MKKFFKQIEQIGGKVGKQLQKPMKKIGQQIERPFKYAQKAGKQQTEQIGRIQTGIQITGCLSNIKLQDYQTIQLIQFNNYLENKGLPLSAIQFFKPLQSVQIGNERRKDFILNLEKAYLQVIGIAVKRLNSTQIKIGIVWKNFTISFIDPETKINYRTVEYGFGWRDSTQHSTTIKRSLNESEILQIKNRLESQAQTSKASEKAAALII